jgi:uncharacterized membrane protein HdeD (DUF308 family)
MTATSKFSDAAPIPVLTRMWWAVLLRAVAAILFAFLAFFWVREANPFLNVLFAVYVAADGAFSLAGAKLGGGLVARGGLALAGLASFVAAAWALWPGVTPAMLATVIGAWAIVRGGLEFVSALTLRRLMERDWSLALIGVLSVLFGAMLVFSPEFEPRMFVRLLSGYSLIVGLLMLLLARRFHRGLRP